MARIKQHELRAYVNSTEYKRMEQEAKGRGLSLSRTVRVCLLEYLKIKEELASSMSDVGALGEEHTGKIIHTLLSRTEERVAATIQKVEDRVSLLYDHLLVVTAMLDRMYLGVMQHLPELPAEMSEAAIASSKRRHEKWIKATQRLLNEGEISIK
jgi:hypothetical protein